MERLSDRQKQVLLRMRSSENTAESLHSFYLTYGQMHHITRMLDYQDIAYYLYYKQRKDIEQYYLDRLKQEKDEDQRVYYGKLCDFLKKFHQQQVDTYEYSKDEIEEKDKVFYQKQRLREQAQRQIYEQQKVKRETKTLSIFTRLWKSLCSSIKKGTFKAQTTEQQEKIAKFQSTQ